MHSMVSVTIRDVPAEVRNELAARAARSGRSLQEYLLGQLERIARRVTEAEFVDRARERKAQSGTRLEVREILAWRDVDRA